MRLSVVISVYQSYEAVRRQVAYWKRLDLADDIEFLLVDDGSDPPLEAEMRNLRILRTGSRLAWTQGLGRNLGAEHARGDYLLMTDIDHILSWDAIEAVRTFEGDRMCFDRYFGVLTEEGRLAQDLGTLIEYGFDTRRLAKRGLYASVHGNTFALKRQTFEELGGYPEQYCTRGYHPGPRQGEDCYFNGRWNRWAGEHGVQQVRGPAIYMFPVGQYHVRGETNPMGLFHDLHYMPGERSYKDA